ncbi:MAG: tRNA (adenosine(37)-N6)-threonylcarbamoyltransferase complex ATPase subunit type 1 TsaE [Vicingaceae bacterium]
METLRAKNLAELKDVSKELVELLEEYPIHLFKGQMGSGKTTLIKNMCTLLGVKEAVSSPTFSLVNEYETEEGETLYHFDFYRIEDPVEALDMGVEEYFESGSPCFVEWPEMITALLPNRYLLIEISLQGEERIYTLSKNKNG